MDTEAPTRSAAPVDQIIERYIALRDKKADLKAAFTQSTEAIDAALERIENFLLKTMQDLGVESLRSGLGTAYKQAQTSATVADWESALDWVKKNEQWAMLEKRVSKSFVEAYKNENADLPPGIDWREVTKVNIRRS